MTTSADEGIETKLADGEGALTCRASKEEK